MQALFTRHIWRRKENLYFGVYDSFEQANAQAARFAKTSWDDDTLARTLVNVAPGSVEQGHGAFQPSYYPYILWLTKMLRPGDQVLDLGGASGIGFELYARYAQPPEGLRWHVVDMPALAERGRLRHGADHAVLSFGDKVEEAPPCTILASAGCIQYMADPFAAFSHILGQDRPPRHILLNKVPLTQGETYWTLQNLITVVSPYRIFNREALLGFFQEHGYHLRDEWKALDVMVDIPFHARKTLDHTVGLVLSRAGEA